MDLFFQKAKILAQETAKRSQEIAKEAAKLSQEIAAETAKRSRELAVEATKTADQIKTFATEELAGTKSTIEVPTDAELQKYGITPEFQLAVKSLTIKDFREYPLENLKKEASIDGRPDLTEWQERHAVLILLTVPEISDFRYVLCPRRMRESRFWKIYFKLVDGHLSLCEQQPLPVSNDMERPLARRMDAQTAEQDLDAYLLGVLDSNEEDQDGDDGAFDADFDKLVNSAAFDTDEEDNSKIHSDVEPRVLSATKAAIIPSEGSSDGELIDIPNDIEVAHG